MRLGKDLRKASEEPEILATTRRKHGTYRGAFSFFAREADGDQSKPCGQLTRDEKRASNCAESWVNLSERHRIHTDLKVRFTN
jgi:hypothetical protein